MGVIEPEVTAMKRRDRRSQAQPKTGTGLGSACFQPNKSFHRMLAIGRRNSRPMVGDAEQHPIALAPGLDQISLRRFEPAGAERLRGRAGLPYLIAFSTRFASAWLISSRLP